MKWTIFGSSGLLGAEIRKQLMGKSVADYVEIHCPSRREVDLREPESVTRFLLHVVPDIVVNAAAWTEVDAAEAEQTKAFSINAEGARAVAKAVAEQSNAVLIHLSTDYVFGHGIYGLPHAESDCATPTSVYGKSKAAGEAAVIAALAERSFILRTGWLYGLGQRNFVSTMAQRALAKQEVSVVDDQWGQPTWTRDLAGQLIHLAIAAHGGEAQPGIYHGTSSGHATWHELTCEIYGFVGANPQMVRRISTDQLFLPAPRPNWSVLGHDAWTDTGVSPLRNWRDALHDALPLIINEVLSERDSRPQ